MQKSIQQNHLPETIMAQLSASDSDDRMWAVFDLDQYEPELIAPELIKKIQDEHRAVREAASEILEMIPPKLVTSDLVPLLGSERIEVRNIVATILTRFGDEVVDELISALTHGNEDVRKFAADILGLNGSDLAVPELCKAALNDDVDNVVVSVIEALGKIGSPKALEMLYKIVLGTNETIKNEAIEAIGFIGDDKSAEFLESQLNQGNPLTLFAVIDALGNIGSESSIIKLKDYYCSDALDVLVEPIVLSMLKIGERKRVKLFDGNQDNLIKTVADIINNGNIVVADLLAFQLSLGQDENVLRYLFNRANQFPSSLLVSLVKVACEFPSLSNKVAELAHHEDEWAAYSAVEALEKYDAEHVGDLVINLLKELDGMPVVAAIRVAVSLGLNKAIPVIETLKDSANDDIKETAVLALNSLT